MHFKDLRYAAKIQVLFVPIFVLMAVGLLGVYQIAVTDLRQQHRERLERTAELTNNGLIATQLEMKRLVNLFQTNRTLREYLYITSELGGDRNALRGLIDPLARTLSIEDIDFFDRRGKGVVDMDIHEQGDEPHDLRALAGYLPTEAQSGLIEMNGLIQIAAFAPLTDAGRVLGYVSIGKYLSAEYLDAQKKISGNDLILVNNGTPYASTIAGYSAHPAPPLRGSIVATGTRYSVREQAITAINGRPLGQLVIALSDEPLEAAIAKLRGLMLGMLLLVAAVSFGISRLFVRALVEPLHKITLFTEKVSRGELDEALTLSGRDEIAVLGEHFNKMRLQLRADRDTVRKYTVDLERMIEQRTTELRKVQDQLLHAQKMEAIGQMAGGIAHDFNNVLTAIIGYAGILQRKLPVDDPLRQYLDQLHGAARRATTLTHGLLAFSRKQVLQLGEHDVNDIIRQVEKLLVRLITEDIELVMELTDRKLPIMADRGQVEQVLMNLVANARDAMPQGGRLSIRTGAVRYDDRCIYGKTGSTHGEFAVLSVADSGTGMDDVTKRKIFEPFFTTKEVGKGTGLGLAMVYGIVQQHEGCITVESEVGQGTTFSVYFPLRTSAVERETPEAVRLAPKGGAETILLGEDDADIRELTRSGLEEAGYSVITATDGVDAVEKFMKHRHRIDLLLLDVVMPRKNGKEVLDEARLAVPAMKAIFMSGYSSDIIKSKGLSDNGSIFLMKPIDLESLLSTVREVLDRKAASRA